MTRLSPPALVLAAIGCSSLPTVGRDASVDRDDVAACDAARCDGRCVDLARDPAHCGACGNACAEGVDCVRGVCSRRVAQLSSELNHVCALLADGSVWCRPEFGGVPALPHLRWTDHVVALEGGWGHVCVLHDDGDVGCGGRGHFGQFGDNNTALTSGNYVRGPVRPLGLPRAVSLAADAEGACARTVEGALWCWGKTYLGAEANIAWVPARIGDVGVVRSLWSRAHGYFLRREDGALLTWGRNIAGALGDGSTTDRWSPVDPRALAAFAGEITSFAAGLDHTCALLRDGTVRCWGSNVRGQLGNGSLGGTVLTPASPRW